MTVYTVAEYLQSANRSLKYWQSQMEKLNNNTLHYDGTLPQANYNALIKNKVKLYTDLVAWLDSLEKTEIMGDDRGLTSLGAEYYKRVNA